MSERLKKLIISELASFNYTPSNEKRIKIHCPFHSDSNPSLNVVLSHQKHRAGTFKCFSCGVKGGWNKLAQKMGLKEDDQDTSKYYDKSQKYDDDPFYDASLEIKATGNDSFHVMDGIEELPMDFEWRGIPREFWIEMGFSYYWELRRDLFYLYQPIKMFGEYIGYTLAAIDPHCRPNEKIIKYQTYASTEKAILMYDQLKPNETIIIVEGHFDSWRLKYLGFNVCAMIGTENWSKYKTNCIMAKLPKRVIICTDGDEAGYKAGNRLNQIFCEEGVDTIYYQLPIIPVSPLDPGNFGNEYIEDLRRYII